MGCTTILLGRKATNDGSTIIARNEDCENGDFNAKTMVVVEPDQQPRNYTGVNSHLTIELPDDPIRYTCVPNVDQSDGVWGEAGINAANVSMSATETISTNARVLGADPLIAYTPAKGKPGEAGYQEEKPGGIGEEDLITIILPYIKTAKEGVLRMGELLETYGTYEMNGVAFGDKDEVWYIETIGGHHWMARRVPDDCFVAQPNRLGIDRLDLRDALGPQKEYMCSADLPKWMMENHLDVTVDSKVAGEELVDGIPAVFDPRQAFGSFTWLDIVYNNPRAYYISSLLSNNPEDFKGPQAKYNYETFDIPWAQKPKAKISVMDVKNLLASTYEGTPYNCYDNVGTEESRHRFRNIGINRTCESSILHIRPDAPKAAQAIQWVSYGSGPFNTAVAMFTNVKSIPAYMVTPSQVTTESLYWCNRLIAGLGDPEYFLNMEDISGYVQETLADGYQSLRETDAVLQAMAEKNQANLDDMDDEKVIRVLEEANQELTEKIHEATDGLLAKVLYQRSLNMLNAFNASDH